METGSGSSSSEMRGYENHLRICIKSQDGDDTYFKVGENTKVRSLLQTYCSSKQLEYKYVVFLHDGKTLRRRGTVAQVGLMDQDVIEAVMHQTGGGSFN